MYIAHDRYLINTDVFCEDWFPIASPRTNPRFRVLLPDLNAPALKKMTTGKKSPVTGEMVRLEVAIGHNSRIVSSIQAYRRFIDRFNGVLENKTSSPHQQVESGNVATTEKPTATDGGDNQAEFIPRV